MKKILLAAAAAFALVAAAPAYAGCPDCKDCPNKVAAADTTEKKDGDKVGCKCNVDTKGECKCGEKCHCPHCHGSEAKKETPKKS